MTYVDQVVDSAYSPWLCAPYESARGSVLPFPTPPGSAQNTVSEGCWSMYRRLLGRDILIDPGLLAAKEAVAKSSLSTRVLPWPQTHGDIHIREGPSLMTPG